MSPMTSHDGNEDVGFVDSRLRLAKRRVKLAEVCSALLTLATYTLAGLMLVVIADHVRTGGLSSEARLTARWCYLIGAAGLLAWLAAVPAARRINDLFAARTLEHHHPEFKNSLVSALQLAWRGELPGSTRAALASRAARDLAATDLWKAVDKRSMRRAGVATLAAAALFLLYAALAPKPVLPSIRRALGMELPAPTRTQIVIEQPPADLETLVDTPVRMVAQITGRKPDHAFVRFSLDGGETWLPDQQLALSPPPTVKMVDARERRRWQAVKPGREVQQSMSYQFVAGDATSEIRLLRVRSYPEIAEVGVRCEYPAYTGLSPTDHPGGDVAAVVGTWVTVKIRTSVTSDTPPVLDFRKTERGRFRTQAVDTSGVRFEGRFRVEASDAYTVDYRDRYGVRNRNPIVYTVEARQDQPPEIELERPEDGVRRSARGSMDLVCRTSDDFGLTDAALGYQVGDQTSRIPLSLPGPEGIGGRAVRIERSVPLRQLGAKPGGHITWWVTVRDNRHDDRGDPAYQSAQSEKRKIIIREETSPPEAEERPPTATRPSEDRPNAPTGRPAPLGDSKAHAAKLPTASAPSAESPEAAPTSQEAASQPGDDLERFVEDHRDELEAMEKHLEDRPTPDSEDKRETSDPTSDEERTGQDGQPRLKEQATGDDSLRQPGQGQREGESESGEGVDEGKSESGHKSGEREAGSGEGQSESGQAQGKGKSESGKETGQGESESESGEGSGEGQTGSGQAQGKGQSESDEETGKGESGKGTGEGSDEGQSGSGEGGDQGE